MTSLRQLAPAEPYRVLFPIGLALGLLGIACWPLYQLHLLQAYPSVIHARLMIEGFIAAFIMGFLGTAGPRFLNAPQLSGREVALFVLLLLALAAAHLASQHPLGDALFLALMLSFTGSFALRFARRQDMPPPEFVLVLMGLLSGIFGAGLLLLAPPTLQPFGQLLLYQGFALFPLLGVGTFLFPRFLGLNIPPSYPDSRTPLPGWTHAALRSLSFGLVILATFLLETKGAPVVAGLVRLAAVLYFLIPKLMPLRAPGAGTVPPALYLALGLLLFGLIGAGFFPLYRIAALHVLFIGGFGLIILLVATRVMYGHSGRGGRLKQRTPFLIVMNVLVLLSLVLRLAADGHPTLRLHLISGAALCWMAGAVVWGSRTIPRVFIPDTEAFRNPISYPCSDTGRNWRCACSAR